MRKVPRLLAAACLGLLGLASAAHAQCTTADEAKRVQASLRKALRCSHEQVAGGAACSAPPAPPCAGDLVRETVALASTFGGASPASDPRERREQLRCQRRIGVASARFVGGMLKQLIRGEPVARAEARARTALAALPDHCLEAASMDGLTAASTSLAQDTAVVAAVTPFIDPNVLRDVLAGALAALALRSAPRPTPAQPNFVLIVTDDQRADTITPQLMPKLNAELIASGVVFPQGFVSNPLCCPSRASILTGRYAHDHGVLHNARGDPTNPTGGVWAFSDVSTVATWLRDQAGYRTGLIGKYLNGYPIFTDEYAAAHGGVHYVPPGWDRWYASHGGVGQHGFSFVDEAGALHETDPGSCRGPSFEETCPAQPPECPHATDQLRDEALRFIDEAARQNRRFFLYFAPPSPHAPACPPLRHRGARRGFPAHRPPSWQEGARGRDDDADKPVWLQQQGPLDARALDALRIRQLESLLAVDDAVGAILQKLRETGQDANTLVVYTSDNGLLWGEHRRGEKSCPYEECLRVPFVVRYPGLAPQPRTESAPVLNVDLAPTFAALAGLDPGALQPAPAGRSLVGLLDGSERAWRGDWLGEHWGEAPAERDRSPSIPTFALVRGPRWKYVEYCTGEIELYDLPRDPYELTNVAGSNPDVVAAQAVRLRELDAEWPDTIPFPCGTIDQEADD